MNGWTPTQTRKQPFGLLKTLYNDRLELEEKRAAAIKAAKKGR